MGIDEMDIADTQPILDESTGQIIPLIGDKLTEAQGKIDWFFLISPS